MKNIVTTVLLLFLSIAIQAQTTYECVFDECVDVGVVGTYESLESCLEECGEDGALDLVGQWYSDDEDEYLQLTADSLFVLYDDGDCFDLEIATAYTLNEDLGYFLIEMEGMMVPVSYELTQEDLSIYVENPMEPMVYVPSDFDVDTLTFCANEPNWSCTAEGCEESLDGSGEFDSLEECEWECFTGEMTYDCGFVGCEEAGEWGEYISLEACESDCEAVEMTYICWPQGCFEAGLQGEFVSMEECEDYCAEAYSWVCGVEGCEEVGAGNGMYDSEEDCIEDCWIGEMTYECWGGACYEANGEGSYSSMEECEEECEESEGTYGCWDGECYEAGSFGSYDSMEACVEECEEQEATYACVLEACLEAGDFGSYATLEECEEACDNTAAITELSEAVQLAPNPFNESTLLTFEEGAQSYRVYDMSGRLVRKDVITAKQHRFCRNDLPVGMYYLEVQGVNSKWRTKLMIK